MTYQLPPMHCPECGRGGNEEDLCVVGEQCPDEECSGIIEWTDGTLHTLRLTPHTIEVLMGCLDTDDYEQNHAWNILDAAINHKENQ